MGILSPTHLIIILVIVLINVAPLAAVLFVVFALLRKQKPPAVVVPAGWLADPTRRHESRFWDGRQWTAAVFDGGQSGTDPL
jgi:hypothetical protein